MTIASSIAKGIIKKIKPRIPKKRDTNKRDFVERLKKREDIRQLQKQLGFVKGNPKADEAAKKLKKDQTLNRRETAREAKTLLKNRGAGEVNRTARKALGLRPKAASKKASRSANAPQRNIEAIKRKVAERRN